MRTILSIISLFSLGTAIAQPYPSSEARELPRGETIVYPTAREATAADGGNNRYFTRIPEWTRNGNTLSAAFTVPFAWANRQVLFHIDAASSDFEVRINGHSAGYNADANVPAEFNITPHVQEGRNTIELVLADPSALAPLESWKPDGNTPAVGRAWILSQPTMRIRDVIVKTRPENDGGAVAEIGIVAKSSALNPRTSRFHYELLTPTGETAASGYKDLTLDMRREDTLRFLARIPANLLWNAELPTLYTLRLKTQHEGRYGEYMEYPLGFRTVETDEQGRLTVNGKKVTLHAVEADPQQVTENELARLRELGYNTLRPTPGPVPADLFSMCDVLGFYVIAQAPLDTSSSGESRRKAGNPSNDPVWLGAFIERTEDSYHTTKRHPSVIAFSLARRSSNGINLYESYLNLKRYDDPRPVIYPDGGGEWNDDPLQLQ